jgi:hypothetical protein
MTQSELELFSGTLNELFASHAHGDIEVQLEEFGVGEFLSEQPADAVPLVFGLQGARATSSSILNKLMVSQLRPLIDDVRGWTALLPGRPQAASTSGTLEDGQVEINALCLESAPGGLAVLAVESSAGVPTVVTVDLAHSGLRVTAQGGLDPWLSLHTVTGSAPANITSDEGDSWSAWESAVMWGRIALAHEILGTVRTSLELANEHAKERIQFGRPIGSFQAVKHRLAEVLIYAEGAQAAADSSTVDPTVLGSLVAKSMSGKAARLAARNCLQVMGGMGFTWEHPLHRFQKRAILLDTVLGSSTSLPAAIGSILNTTGSVPRLVAL